MKKQQENLSINLLDLQTKYLINTNATNRIIVNEVMIGTIHRQDEDIHLTLNEQVAEIIITSFPSPKGLLFMQKIMCKSLFLNM